VVLCLVKELIADVNQPTRDGVTPLVITARCEQEDVVAFLVKYGANVQMVPPTFGTAADLLRKAGASAEQTQYL
jgi:ankyrin repeat protein